MPNQEELLMKAYQCSLILKKYLCFDLYASDYLEQSCMEALGLITNVWYDLHKMDYQMLISEDII